MRHLAALLLAVLVASPAFAQDEDAAPTTTAALSGLPTGRVTVDPLQHQVGGDHLGAAGWGTSFWMPPALLAPQLGLSYSSFDLGFDAEMPRGWSLSGLLEIQRDRRHRDEFVLSGPIRGRLVERALASTAPGQGRHYRLETTDEGALSAVYFESSDRWELRDSAGITWTLEEVASTGGESAHWKVKRIEDVSGNAVDYRYADTRLVRVEFGGVPSRMVPHGLCVDLGYVRRNQPVSVGALGNLHEYDRLLQSVTVGRLPTPVGPRWEGGDAHQEDADAPHQDAEASDEDADAPHEGSTCQPQWRMELDVDEAQGEPLLMALRQIGIDRDKFGRTVELEEPIVEFDYEAMVRGTADPTREASWTLPDLGRTRSYTHFSEPEEVSSGEAPIPGDYTQEWRGDADVRNFLASVTESRLVDWNGDGLLDWVETDGDGGWTVHLQWLDRDSGARGWTKKPRTYSWPDMPHHISESRQTMFDGDIYDYHFLESTNATLADLDGDGLPDFVWHDLAPNDMPELVPGTTSWDPKNRTTLNVRYGTGDGFTPHVFRVDSPFGVLQVEDRLEELWPPNGLAPEAYEGDPVNDDVEWVEPRARGTLRMYDFDGDGWQDLVTNIGRHIAVAFHGGERGAGWSTMEVIDAPWSPGDASTQCEYDLRRQSLSYRLSWATCEGNLRGAVQPRPPGTYMDLVDVNGDGLLDKLVGGDCALEAPLAGGRVGADDDSIASGEAMVAYLSNGAGYESGRPWSSPSTLLSQANPENRRVHNVAECVFWDQSSPQPFGETWYWHQMNDWVHGARGLVGCTQLQYGSEQRAGQGFSETQEKQRLLDVDGDGLDNDLDGVADCNDSDCSADVNCAPADCASAPQVVEIEPNDSTSQDLGVLSGPVCITGHTTCGNFNYQDPDTFTFSFANSGSATFILEWTAPGDFDNVVFDTTNGFLLIDYSLGYDGMEEASTGVTAGNLLAMDIGCWEPQSVSGDWSLLILAP